MLARMPHIRFSYFNIKGNRGQVARLAFDIAGLDYEDVRLDRDAFRAAKPSYPFGQVPVIEIDGKMYAQSGAINRYVGKLCNLYPEDALECLRVDEITEAIEDLQHRLRATMDLPADERKAAREAYVEGPLRLVLSRLQERLSEGGGEYFVGNRLSIADLRLLVFARWFESGIVDHIPTDVVARIAPELHALAQRVYQVEAVRKHYES